MHRAPGDFLEAFLRIRVGWLFRLHNLLDGVFVLLQALLYVCKRQALRVCALIGHRQDAPCSFFLRKRIICPEPVPARLFQHGCSHRHFEQRAAQRRLRQFE